MTSSSATGIDDGIPGAYGLRFSGLESLGPFLVRPPATWPLVTVDRSGAADVAGDTSFDSDSATSSVLDHSTSVTMHGVRLDREPLRASLGAPRDDASMIHPGLALIGSVMNRWLGRDVFHAGAFARGGGAWVVLGAKEAGKSSLLGLLAARDLGILCDDVLVVDDGQVLAGPRCIDLREGAATWLGRGEDIGQVGDRRRWRMAVPAGPPALPLRGWIVPTWGSAVTVEPVAARQRLALLYANLAINRAPQHPVRFLRFGSLPFLEFRRPRSWALAADAADVLLGVLDALPG